MKVDYRIAEEKDLRAVHDILREALDRFAVEQNRPRVEMDFQGSLPLWHHFLGTSQGGFWIAEVKGRPVGFTCGIVRDHMWLVSFLVVLPEHQGAGLARELLERVLESSYSGKVEVRAAYADAANLASVSLYTRHGLYPQVPILRMEGLISRLRPGQDVKDPPEHVVAELDEESVRILGVIDASAQGTSRAVDHRYWLGAPEMRCYLFRKGDEPAGYAYLSDDGNIGPLAATKPAYLKPILNMSVDRLADQGLDTFQVRVPGLNREALSLLYQRAFTLLDVQLVLSSAPFGRWENYIISPAALL
ncbi:MAG: GNAT family N-acetyltransferase [Anaerolineae bacterium]